MSSCNKSDSIISFLMDELKEEERTVFAEHLTVCPICRYELGIERAVQNQLVRSTMPERAPAGLKSSVLEKILLLQRPRFPWRQIAITLLSGTAVFLLLQPILKNSDLLVSGWGILADFSEWISGIFGNSGSLPVVIAIGSVIAGISAGLSLRIQGKA